jgi:hypothetical protein
MKGYFRLKRSYKVLQVGRRSYYQWRSRFHTENKELGLLKKKDSIYFDSKQRYGSPRITAEYTSLGTKLSRIPVVNTYKN